MFKQVIGIPSTPFLANSFLYSYEAAWMENQTKTNYALARKFNHTLRYIDDLATLNNNGNMAKLATKIYPKELDLKHENKMDDHATFLDIDVSIVAGGFSTKLYDKRDAFPFQIVSFPDLSGNICSKVGYGTFTSQIIRIARACMHWQDFKERAQKLTNKLLQQHHSLTRLRTVFLKTWNRHEMQKRYKKSETYGGCQ